MNVLNKPLKYCSLFNYLSPIRTISTLSNNSLHILPNPAATISCSCFSASRIHNYISSQQLRPSLTSSNCHYYSTNVNAKKILGGGKQSLPDPSADEGETDDLSLTPDLVHHLERTSLVDFDDEEALSRLEEAVRFASTIFEVDTSGVEPMVSVLENEPIHMRDDTVGETVRSEILMNASITEEDYFVSPPGNIPLDPKESFKKEKAGR